MMMNVRLQELLTIYSSGPITEDQRLELISLLGEEGTSAQFADLVQQQLVEGAFSIEGDLSKTEDKIVREVLTQIQSGHVIPFSQASRTSLASRSRRTSFLRKWGWAAAVLLAIGAGVSLWRYEGTTPRPMANTGAHPQPDADPGSNKAILTLSDGTVIPLDSAANGAIARQGNTSVVKQAGGQISYDLKGAETAGGEGAGNGAGGAKAIAASPLMNTLHTPRGGQYQLTLPDGTRVWLNAASSITYPVAFAGKQRTVQISGEAYLEVAENKDKPFIVNVEGGSSIEVLGTHFNVNSYSDESAVKTTLLEGSIKVAANAGPGTAAEKSASVVLKPGQQAQIARQRLSVSNNADMDKVLAWKNGLFNFDDVRLEEVLRQLSRWYDVEVVYEKGVPDIQFEGEISRNIKLSDLLKVLARADVKFRIEEGRRLVVLP